MNQIIFLIDKKSGKKIVHTINPINGDAFPTNVLGTSVVAEDCIIADAYATSFMAMPLEKSKSLISKLKNIEVMIVYYDENNIVKVYRTEGFEKLNFFTYWYYFVFYNTIFFNFNFAKIRCVFILFYMKTNFL